MLPFLLLFPRHNPRYNPFGNWDVVPHIATYQTINYSAFKNVALSSIPLVVSTNRLVQLAPTADSFETFVTHRWVNGHHVRGSRSLIMPCHIANAIAFTSVTTIHVPKPPKTRTHTHTHVTTKQVNQATRFGSLWN
jgi:hypothetical protein